VLSKYRPELQFRLMLENDCSHHAQQSLPEAFSIGAGARRHFVGLKAETVRPPSPSIRLKAWASLQPLRKRIDTII